MGFLRECTLLQVKINLRSPDTSYGNDAYCVNNSGGVYDYNYRIWWNSCGRSSPSLRFDDNDDYMYYVASDGVADYGLDSYGVWLDSFGIYATK